MIIGYLDPWGNSLLFLVCVSLLPHAGSFRSQKVPEDWRLRAQNKKGDVGVHETYVRTTELSEL